MRVSDYVKGVSEQELHDGINESEEFINGAMTGLVEDSTLRNIARACGITEDASNLQLFIPCALYREYYLRQEVYPIEE